MEVKFYNENSTINTLSENNNFRRLMISDEMNLDKENDAHLINKSVYGDLVSELPELCLEWLATEKNKMTFLREMYVSKALEAVVLICNEPVPKTFIEQYVVKIIHSEGLSSTQIINESSDGEKSILKKKDGKYYENVENEQINESVIKNQSNYTLKERVNDFKGVCEENKNSILRLEYVAAVPGNFSAVWLVSFANFDISYGFSVEIRSILKESFLWQCDLHPSKQESLIHVDTDIHRILCDNISNFVSNSTLINDLAFARKLLDMDSTNKCSLIAIVSLLRLISPLESREEIIDILMHRLPYVDSINSQFYFDAASKFIIECHLISLHNSHLRHVSLTSQGLTMLSYLSWMTLMTDVDLSNNQLSFLPDTFCHYLLCLTKLNLSNNQIVSLLPLKGLRSIYNLNVSHNLISRFQDLEPVLFCRKLVYLNIKGNVVAQLPNLTNLITDHPTSRLHIGSLSIVYDKNL